MQTKSPSPVPATDPPPPLSPGEAIDAPIVVAPAVAETTVTSVRCPKCTTGSSWKGPLTDEMIARTFERGVDADTGLPKCPRCGTVMQLTAVEDLENGTAIEQAAAQLPERTEAPRQARIPGLSLPFDSDAALVSILEQRAVVRRAEAIAETKHKEAQKATKLAKDEQATLSRMEDEYADRRADAALEASMSPEDRRARGCSFEALTGTPCTLCRQPPKGVTPAFNGNPKHVIAAAHHLAQRRDLTPAALVQVVKATIAVALVPTEVAIWMAEDVKAVTAWLEAPQIAPRPEILGRAHEVSEIAGQCKACGTLLTPLAVEFGLEAWPVGQLIGTDCSGPAETVEPARRPQKRHASPKSAARAKQSAAKAERQASSLTRPGGLQPVEKSRSRTAVHQKPRLREKVGKPFAKGRRR